MTPSTSVPAGAPGRLRWLLSTLPLAPLAAVLYLFSEWLFFVTKPSPTSALPLLGQLRVLVESPGPVLLPLLAVQAVASLLSIAVYPKARGVAVVPAAAVGGWLLLVLIDNFTHTVLGVGIMRSGEVVRIVYTAVLPMLVLAAGWKIVGWVDAAITRRATPVVATCAAAVLAALPVVTKPVELPTEPDPSVLPVLQAAASATSRPNILFLGVDGLDADITSAYGYARQTTPFLESIREDTLLFEHAYSNVARTHGSLVTLLTGRLPFSTRVTFPPTLLQGADGDRTFPMLLKSLGYTTMQLGMRHYADAEDTNVHGFDAANYRWQKLGDPSGEGGRASDTDVFRTAVSERMDDRFARLLATRPVGDSFAHVEGRSVDPQWKDERRVATLEGYFAQAPRPWFVHLHLLDTHCCNWHPGQRHFTDGSRSVDFRDSQVLETDGHIRRLFAALERTGQLENTIVVINSDHASEWKITARVPLMIRFPNRQYRGRVSANVQLADVAPTILAYLGASAPAWMDGTSVLDAASIDRTRPIFGVSDIQAREGASGKRLLRDGGAHNFGASAVMMVVGSQVFNIDLATGDMVTERALGPPIDGAPIVSDAAAREMLLGRLRSAGIVVAESQMAAAATP